MNQPKLIRGKLLVFALVLLAFTTPLAAHPELDEASLVLRQFQRDLLEGKIPQQEVRSRVVEIEILLNEGILRLLNQPSAVSSEQLREKLSRTLSWWDSPSLEVATVLAWGEEQSPLFIIAYTIGYSAINGRSFVGVFGARDGVYRLVASVEDPLPDRYIRLVPIDSERADRIAFLAYGTRWGDAHTRLTAIAYVLDGNELQSIWTRRDLPRGHLKLEHGKILLYSVDDTVRPWRERTEIYRVTATGIEHETTSEKPLH